MIRVPYVALAVALTVTLCACTVSEPPETALSQTPSPTPTVPVSSETLVAADRTDTPPSPAADEMLGVVPCATAVTDAYGSYYPICVRDDAPVLRFDPAGQWSWVVTPPGAPIPLDPQYVASAVDQAGRLLVDLIDSPAQWDDSPQAWSGIGARVGSLLNRAPDDLRTVVASRPEKVGMFDVDQWREAAGNRPADYPTEGPRIRVLDLRVSQMSVSAGEPASRDNIGVTVTVQATFTQPVIDTDGTPWELRQHVSLVVSSLEATGAVRDLEWSEDHVVGRNLRGGQQSLPEFPIDAAMPTGWLPQSIGALTFALPDGSTLAEESVEGATVPWKRFDLPDGPREFDISGPELDHDPAPEGGWWVLPGFANYGLDIPGSEVAAAEIGTDGLGRYRARVDLRSFEHGSTRKYHVEWDTTPERAEAELREVVGALSVAVTEG